MKKERPFLITHRFFDKVAHRRSMRGSMLLDFRVFLQSRYEKTTMKKIVLFLLPVLASCSTPTVNQVGDDYRMTKEELLSYYGFYDEGKLNSVSVEYNAYKLDLPTFVYEKKILISSSVQETYTACQEVVRFIGTLRSNDLPNNDHTIIGVTGSGSMGMNPAGILVYLSEVEEGTIIRVRAVSKEGKLTQNTSARAVEKFIDKLKSNSSYKVSEI